MTTAIALCASVLSVSMCAAATERGTALGFSCNVKAISASERPRYNELIKRIRAAIRNRSEIGNGYAFRMDGKAVTLPEAAEWVSMERLCCPFLTLQLSASGNQADWLLALSGPIGVKQLIAVEFPIR